MSISIQGNQVFREGGFSLFVPEDCEYLSESKLEINDCVVHLTSEPPQAQLIKTLYGSFLGKGSLTVSGDSVCLNGALVFCSGDLQEFAKRLSDFCTRFSDEDISW
jgi:hypothetical protein